MAATASLRRKIRVVSVVDDLTFGGDEARLLAFAATVNRELVEHTVLAIQRASSLNEASSAMRAQFAATGIEIVDLGVANALEVPASPTLRYRRALTRVVQKTYRLTKALRAMDVDVVDARLTIGGLIGSVAASLARRPALVTLYDVPSGFTSLPDQGRSSWQRAVWNLVGQLTFLFCDAVMTDSMARADGFKRWMWRRRPVFVVPNGIFGVQSARTREEMLQLLGIPTGTRRKVVGQVSGLIPYKGHMVLLEAAARVLREAPDAFFLMVGYDRTASAYKKSLEERADALGITHSVRIVSYPGPIADVWKTIDIHVHASLMDSLPNAIIEGMSLGCPAVVTSVGGIPELVANEETGLIVPAHDAVRLADAILDLLRRPEKAAALGAAAYRRYCDRYRVEVMTRAIEDIFAAMARRPSGPQPTASA